MCLRGSQSCRCNMLRLECLWFTWQILISSLRCRILTWLELDRPSLVVSLLLRDLHPEVLFQPTSILIQFIAVILIKNKNIFKMAFRNTQGKKRILAKPASPVNRRTAPHSPARVSGTGVTGTSSHRPNYSYGGPLK